jgi:hypothetical protein
MVSVTMSVVSEQAVALLEKYAGHYFAQTYASFYRDQPDEVIRESVREVLTELVGERKANELVTEQLTDRPS